MRRAWIGLALLSASWLFGLSYFRDANWIVWAVLVAGGTASLIGIEIRTCTRAGLLAAALLAIPALLVAPWPYRAAVLLVVIGALLSAAPIPRRWPTQVGAACVTAGTVLLVQSLGMLAYESLTARSHELPRVFAYVLSGIARLLGIDAALDGTTLALHSMRHAHRLGATWELLLDPATWCFLLGGAALLHLRASGTRGRKPPWDLLRSVATLILAVALWLPARSALLIAVFMHRALRTGYDAPLMLMNQFWSPLVNIACLLGPMLLAMRLVRLPRASAVEAPSSAFAMHAMSAALSCAGILLITIAMVWHPQGPRKQGRVLVDEHNSTWERTDRPYDTEWYGHESGYNYACIYDYCSHFFEMNRLDTAIDAHTLDECDVLMVKVPTSRYSAAEIAHIERFVEDGGGLLLVGEHTTVFNTGTHLNDIANRFGFRFHYDCLFEIDTVFTQLYRLPLVPHPIVQSMPPFDFAVSCSIAPGASAGRAAIRATGLRNLPADYHASNFYPQVEDRAESRYGAFIQLWTTRRDAGRIVAFADSTVFSNFSTFEPGKAELMLGMLDWLNHRNPRWDVRPMLFGLGVLLAIGALVLARKWSGPWLVLLTVALLGWSVAVMAARAGHRAAAPLPQPARPFTHVVIDRTACDAPLSKSGFIAGEQNGFGIFERWILRLGYFTSRRQGTDAFAGDLLVFLHPNQPVDRTFRTALREYVAAGGKALILDSPANTESTANTLLYPFGLTVEHATPLAGALAAPEGWPTTATDAACEVKGGTALIRINETPVAATIEHGQGTVTVVGFGSRFADARMGVTGDVVPDTQLRDVYELQFSLLRSILSEAP